MSEWNLGKMPDCTGQNIVVTGANSGLGLEATREFARKGGTVVMACRSIERAAEAADQIRESLPAASLDVRELDLADLDSVRAFAGAMADEYGRIDVLCNNAGVMAIPRTETADGFETQLGVNHLGHFALTELLRPALQDAPDPRVVTQSSGMHARGDIDFEDLHGEEGYDPWDAYAQSKLANVLFAYELDRRYGDEVTSVACHPGYAATNLQYRGPEAAGSRLKLGVMKVANLLFAQSAARGALPMLCAATSETIDGGEYVGPGGLLNMRGQPEKQRSSSRSSDEELAARLWERSEELTDVSFE